MKIKVHNNLHNEFALILYNKHMVKAADSSHHTTILLREMPKNAFKRF